MSGRRRFPYKPLSEQHGLPWPHPPGARPDVVRRSATIKTTAPVKMIEVRAVKGAVVYSSDDMPIPEEQFIHVELTPHIARAIRERDLEQRPRPSKARKAGNPVAATPAKTPTKKAAKTPRPARSMPRRVAGSTPKQKSAKRRTKRTKQRITLKRDMSLQREMTLAILHDIAGYANKKTADLKRLIHNRWEEECARRRVSSKQVKPPSRDLLARMTDRRHD